MFQRLGFIFYNNLSLLILKSNWIISGTCSNSKSSASIRRAAPSFGMFYASHNNSSFTRRFGNSFMLETWSGSSRAAGNMSFTSFSFFLWALIEVLEELEFKVLVLKLSLIRLSVSPLELLEWRLGLKLWKI